jgi:hypothetical protein
VKLMRAGRTTVLLLAIVLLTHCVQTKCGQEPPSTAWDLPLCTDIEFDASLLDNATHGDHSALELLQRRFETVLTYGERHHIAATLLRLAPDDRPYWNELNTHAENALRFQGDDEAASRLDDFCREQGCEPDRYLDIADEALRLISDDPRALSLLRRTLESKNVTLVGIAIDGLATQRDQTSLEAIDAALARFPEDAGHLAASLSQFQSETANRIAAKYQPREEQTTTDASPNPDAEPPAETTNH